MRVLDEKIRSVHETYWNVEQERARGKSVVLVEGDDDRDVIETIFRQRTKTWQTRVRVVAAGGRMRVLTRMKSTFPHAFGVVDRDTWTDAEIELYQREEPRLFVTEDWCLENTFFRPDWLQGYPRCRR